VIYRLYRSRSWLAFFVSVALLSGLGGCRAPDGEEFNVRVTGFDPPRAYPGQTIRILGQNFATGSTPNQVLAFTAASENSAIVLSVINAEPSALTVQLPITMPPGQYRLQVSTNAKTARSTTLLFVDSKIIGTWRSKGVDIAPLLITQPTINLTNISHRLGVDNSLVSTYRLSNGQTYSYTGTYTIGDPTTPLVTTLNFTYPTLGQTLTGISFVAPGASGSPDQLSLEFVAPVPSLPGFTISGVPVLTPPTPTGGFGSTNRGAIGQVNVQIFRRE
jgi:hypothetical protein